MLGGGLLAGITACTPAPTESPVLDEDTIANLAASLEENGHSDQAAALSDGKVSAEEYEAAFERLRSCIEEDGYAVTDFAVSPLTGTTYEFAYFSNGKSDSVASAHYAECETAYWQPTAGVYADTAPQRIDEPLKAAIVLCMEKEGEGAEPEAQTFTELVGYDSSQERREVASNCAQESAAALYPELRTLGVMMQPPSG